MRAPPCLRPSGPAPSGQRDALASAPPDVARLHADRLCHCVADARPASGACVWRALAPPRHWYSRGQPSAGSGPVRMTRTTRRCCRPRQPSWPPGRRRPSCSCGPPGSAARRVSWGRLPLHVPVGRGSLLKPPTVADGANLPDTRGPPFERLEEAYPLTVFRHSAPLATRTLHARTARSDANPHRFQREEFDSRDEVSVSRLRGGTFPLPSQLRLCSPASRRETTFRLVYGKQRSTGPSQNIQWLPVVVALGEKARDAGSGA